MALLASCWLIIESFIIPDGFLKWFYLSFYIHPIFLAFCQIFLWLKELQRWLLLLLLFHFRIASCLCSLIFTFLSRVTIFLFSFVRPTRIEAFYDAMEQEIPHNRPPKDGQIVVFEMGNQSQVGSSFDTLEANEEMDLHICVKDSWLDEYLSSDHYNSSVFTYDDDMTEGLLSNDSRSSFCSSFMDQAVDFDLQDSCPQSHEGISGFVSLSKLKASPSDQELIQEPQHSEISSSHSCDPQFLEDMHRMSQGGSVSPISNFDDCYTLSATDLLVFHGDLPIFCSSNSPVRALEQQLISGSPQEDRDPFHHQYIERMRFFDVLYQDRLYGLNAILDEHSTSPGLFNSTESSTDSSMQHILWSKMARKKLLRSLECDFELIYVAQSCLSWEALHHQYKKIESVITSSNNSQNRLFHHSISEKFQNFQILLERFVEQEDKTSQGQRYSNYTKKRLPFQGGLLRVPDVTGFMEEEINSTGGEATKATEVLKAIEKCIKAFWLYVKTDNKKSLWKYKSILLTHPPVEDPGDLELLYTVTKALNKKRTMLKDLQGKKRCWLRRKVEPLQAEDEKRHLLFAMIDMKLVQRLLKMDVISTSQLNWCQDRVNNIEFRQGKVYRGPTGHMFPSS